MTAIPVPVDPQLKRLYEVARAYRAKGYRVVVGPSQSELPPFLRGVEPDVLALSDGDNAVVEVKRRDQILGTNELEEMARRIESEQGWRLELVLLAAERMAEDPLPERADFGHVESLLARARMLLPSVEAIVPAWAAVEHVILVTAQRAGLSLPSNSPTAALKTLFAYGLLSDTAYDRFTAAMRLRNAVVHGRTAEGNAAGILEWLENLIPEVLSEQVIDDAR